MKKEDALAIDNATYKVRLVVKGYSQVEDIDYNYIFLLIVKHNSIHVLLELVASHNLELE